MLRLLRLQLTLLFSVFAIGLVVLMGFGSYLLINYIFQLETDQALQFKMATQFRQYGFTLPAELARVERNWSGSNTRNIARPVPTLAALPTGQTGEMEEEGEDESAVPTMESTAQAFPGEDSWEEEDGGRLSSIFVLPIDAQGAIIQGAIPANQPWIQDQAAIGAAMANGYDLRTVTLVDGSRLRLLTYRTDNPEGPVLFQVGRSLNDNDHVLQNFLWGLLIMGSAGILMLGLGSWWLSGRSLGPAQKAWDQQQAFVSNASHELRTPLTLIKASAEFALRGQPEGEQQALLGDILGETDYMNKLVEDLLVLSRLDAGRLELKRESIDLAELISETARQMQKLAGERGIELVVGAVGGRIWGDRIRLRQVLLILLDNALRFTTAGGTIWMETSRRDKKQQVIVRDNGAGIPAENLPHVFERFYQANPTGEGQTRYNGLGLSIAKGVIEAQGGHIDIQSQIGKGTRVILELASA